MIERFLSHLRDLVTLVARYRKRSRAYILQCRGIELTEWDERVLRALNARFPEEMSFRDIAEVLGQDRVPGQTLHSSTISQVLKRLETKLHLICTDKKKGGLRKKKSGPKNFHTCLTDEGRDLTTALIDAEELVLRLLVRATGLESESKEPGEFEQRLGEILQRAVANFSIQAQKGSSAGVYDCFLAGRSHSVFDRDVAAAIMRQNPYVRGAAIANRAFLRRAVRHLATNFDVTQYVDIGSGWPTMGNTHDIAQAGNPDARVVYVDFDPEVVAKSQKMLRNNSLAKSIQGNLRMPEQLLAEVEKTGLIDFSKRVAIVLVAVVHLIENDALAARVLRVLREHLRGGGFFVVSHGVKEDYLPELAQEFSDIYHRMVGEAKFRSRAEIVDLLQDVELLDPRKLVYTPEWHPEIKDDFLQPDYEPPRAFEMWQALAVAAVAKVAAHGKGD